MLMPLESNTNLNAELEYNNLGLTGLKVAISSSSSTWKPIGKVLDIAAQASIEFKLSDLTQANEGFLVVYNASIATTGLGAIEFRSFEPLCGTGLTTGNSTPEIFRGNLVFTRGIHENQNILDLTLFASGAYIIQITKNSEPIYSSKIMKQ